MTSAVLPTYARADLAFERGEGADAFTADGTRYLDFGSGIAVNALGHAHPALVAALSEQAGKIWHTANTFRIPGQERLAERLCAATFADVAFFCNSGAEANEAAIKMARKYQSATGHPERWRIVTFEGAFHGRTLATIAAGGQEKLLAGFGPRVDGFDQVPFGDLEAVKRAITPETAAILIEPIQGEGGVRAAAPQFLRALRALCDDKDLILVFDEVQCGLGRTGFLFAHEMAGITPDIMAIAKALGGGFPVGACLATARAAIGMTAGTHGSTFGGNPLAMAVGNAVLDVILAPGFLEHVRRMALLLRQRLAGLIDTYPMLFEELRGEGLMIGLKCRIANTDILAALRDQHLLAVGGGDNTIRLLPPLIIEERHIEEAMEALNEAALTLTRARRESAA